MGEIIDKLNWRYATKKFSDKKISEKDFDELLETLRLSPSSYGLQPWKFIVVENRELREKLREAAYGQESVTNASHLIALCAIKDLGAHKDKHISNTSKMRDVPLESLKKYDEMISGFLDRHGKSEKDFALNWAKRQVYIALGFLLSVCAMKKIDSCPIEGMDEKKADEILGLDKKGLECVALCALGYRDKEDKYSKLKKVRFSKKEVVEFR